MTPAKSDSNDRPTLSPAPTCVGLIPARAGSKRVPNKNVRELAGQPLLAYSICAALDSGVLAKVIVSTESDEIAALAVRYGAEVPFLRPVAFAGDTSPDIEWLGHALAELAARGDSFECFAILRPTSPFRQPETIRRAFAAFVQDGRADSLRAVEKCGQHPAKMWIVEGARMRSLMTNPDTTGTPWHSTPYQALPPIYVQNASLEIARCDVPRRLKTIAGDAIMPFLTQGLEGFDINTSDDWLLAEHHAARDPSALPRVRTRP